MLAPDLTYSFRQPKDTSGPTFEVFSRILDLTDTAASIINTLTDLPKDRLLVLANVSVLAIPGATQSLSNIIVSTTTAAGLTVEIVRETPVAVADQNRSLSWQGEVFVLGGGLDTIFLTVSGTFSAGVNANRILAGVHGVVIPRANASPF